MTKVEDTPSGGKIFRYQERSSPFEIPVDSPDLEKIEAHIDRYIGKVETVLHEVVSAFVHVDVLYVKPTPRRNFHTLITCGMSARPMKTPEQMKKFCYSELMICLPPEWKFTGEAMKDEKYYWPIRTLKTLARFPHEYDTWLSYGHTLPNGDPPAPYADNTKLSGVILSIPITAPKDFFALKIDENKTIYFFCMIPLHTDEMNFKLKHGADELFNRLDAKGVNEVLDVTRENVCQPEQ
jgi:hypothetical protein